MEKMVNRKEKELIFGQMEINMMVKYIFIYLWWRYTVVCCYISYSNNSWFINLNQTCLIWIKITWIVHKL